MLSVKDLADSLGLSISQVRRRLAALDGIIDKHTRKGKKSKLLVDSGGLEMLKRLETLREEGLTIDDAVTEIREEIKENDPVDQSANQREPSEKEELLKEQIDQLQSEVQYLRKKLDQKDERIQQLLPGKVEDGNGKAETDEFKELSLVQVVKRWFTTKV